MTVAYVLISAALGLVIGSFLNVVVWRLPRGESVVRPRSHCPGCGAGIRPRDEIPVLSWLLLRGKCRDCGTAIGARYPSVELLTGLIFAAMALRFPLDAMRAESWPVLPAYLYLASVGIALALIDTDTKRLPDKLTLPSYPVAALLLALAVLLGAPAGRLLLALGGMAVMFGVYFALWFAVPNGMGFGDVKLAGVLGLYLGWLGWGTVTLGMLLGWFAGGTIGIALMATGRAGRKTKIPFGPFMIAGAFAAVLVGRPLLRVWLG